MFRSFHPLTILSFAVEQQLAGRNPVLLHAINVVLHAITAILVFLLLQDVKAMLHFGDQRDLATARDKLAKCQKQQP